MKVLHLGKLCPPKEGGIEIFSYDLLEYLNKKGIRADLLCFGDETAKKEYRSFEYFESKMNIKLNSAPLSLDFIKTFKQIEKNYDITHVHSPNPLAEILSLFASKKVIIHWHSDIVRQKISYMFYKPIQQLVLKKAERIICTSPQYLESSNQIKGFKEKAVVIPLGLNPDRLKSDKEDKKWLEIRDKLKNKKVVLSVGRLVYYKGFEYLIESAKYLNDNTIVLIVGAGPLYEDLINLIKKLALEEKVYLIGKVENIQTFIKKCDVFCLPSVERSEAFGLVLVEALFYGKPLVTTEVYGSGMSYVNKNNITGLVVPPKNPKALADAINKILMDKDLYQKFSKNALERFKEFEISSVGDKILALYEEVLIWS
ncbi:glycosyl transferase group 1 [Thermocrinis albus DSM 14484]|uniref:Glycosyl transferase group 1 n=1 Tax=Thermocrinis albus (strain DSM 14484 / JCM 11386 / HI 11/12) TaxID=638303 RepID=D3SNN4_THEAH|nr:glycosyltransferase [Thermocrinis albus]ADC88771.1 glycosyl transferase group 1 [Thermocrinis albus DSM 14484]